MQVYARQVARQGKPTESNHYSNDKPLPFLQINHHQMKQMEFIDFKGNAQTLFHDKEHKFITNHENNPKKESKRNMNASDLVRFIPEDVIESITPLLAEIFQINQQNKSENHLHLHIPNVVQCHNGLFEDVSDLNGIAIPCMYYDHLGQCYTNNVLQRLISNSIQDMKPNEHSFLKSQFASSQFASSVMKIENTSDYLYLSNLFIACQEKLYYRLKQIQRDEYTWLSQNTIQICMNSMDHVIRGTHLQENEIYPEKILLHSNMETEHIHIDRQLDEFIHTHHVRFRFSARVDILTKDTLWELKCTSQLSIEHMLQLILYAWIYELVHQQKKQYKLYNIKSGEVLELHATMEQMTLIITTLLQSKLHDALPISDDEFLIKYKD